MKKNYYIKAETSKDQLQKLGFKVVEILDIKMATRKSPDGDREKDLYIPMNDASAFTPFRIYHDANNQMVKASEIMDLVESGIVR